MIHLIIFSPFFWKTEALSPEEEVEVDIAQSSSKGSDTRGPSPGQSRLGVQEMKDNPQTDDDAQV